MSNKSNANINRLQSMTKIQNVIDHENTHYSSETQDRNPQNKNKSKD